MNISGKISEFQNPTPTVTNIIIQKTAKKKPYKIKLVSFGDTSSQIKQELRSNDFVKFNFVIRSREYNLKYYTDLIVISFELIRRKEERFLKTSQTVLVDLETGEIIDTENQTKP